MLEWHFRVTLEWLGSLKFCGKAPVHVKTDAWGELTSEGHEQPRVKHVCSNAAHFYTQMSKKGMVAAATNFYAFLISQ